MTDPFLALLLAAGLLCLNAFFVAAEFALTAADRTRIAELAHSGSRSGRIAQQSARELSLMLAGAQLGITGASIALGFVAEPVVAHLLELALGSFWQPGAATLHLIAFPLALATVTVLHMVFGEILPKNVALTIPTRLAIAVAIPFRVFANVVRVVIWVLNHVANLVVRIFGIEPEEELEVSYTRRDLEFIVEDLGDEGELDKPELDLLESALGFSELRVREAMTPRPQMISLDSRSTPAQAADLALRSGRSRFPVYDGAPDTIIGKVEVVDLYRLGVSAWSQPLPQTVISPLPAVYENASIAQSPVVMRSAQTEMLLVVDEHGDAAGLLTVADIASRLVGGPVDPSQPPASGLIRGDDGSWTALGQARAGDLAEALRIELPAGQFDTVAGLVLNQLDAIPSEGSYFAIDGWLAMVAKMSGARIDRVRFIPDSPRVRDS